MALDVFEIKLNKRQEKKVLEIAGKQGHFTLFYGKEGKLRISAEKEKPRAGETRSATVDLNTDHYEWLFGWLGQQGIVPSEDLLTTIEAIVKAEREVEEAEFVKTVEALETTTATAVEKLRTKLESEMKADVSAKLKNDYRHVLKRLDARDYKSDYIAKWTIHALGEREGVAYATDLTEIEDHFGNCVLRCRLYGRIFVDDAKPIKAGKGLKWLKLTPP